MPTPQQMVEYLVTNGMSPVAATGLVARWQQESGQQLNSGAVGDGGISYGIGQWNRERLANLKASGLDWRDPYAQAQFALSELGYGQPGLPGYGSEQRAGDLLRKATDPASAVAGAMSYERPQGFTWATPQTGHGYGNTMNNFAALAGTTPPAGGGQQAGEASVADYRAGKVGPDQPVYVGAAPVTPVQEDGTPAAAPTTAVADATTPAKGKPEWRKKLAKLAGNIKMPAVAKSDTTLAGMATPGNTRVDSPEIAPFDQNEIANQRQNLAMAMAKLNTGKLWL